MMTILTDAALAAETIWVTQSTKQWIVLIDVDDRVVGKAATLSRQESRRIDFARMTDEHHTLPVTHTEWRPVNAALRTIAISLWAKPWTLRSKNT